MSIQPLEVVDFDTKLEWNPEPPCEHVEHDERPDLHHGAAWALIQRLRPCGCPVTDGEVIQICKRAWDLAGTNGLYCADCGATSRREQMWRFIALVRP